MSLICLNFFSIWSKKKWFICCPWHEYKQDDVWLLRTLIQRSHYLKLLIADDDSDIRELLVSIIHEKKSNLDIVEAQNGLEAFNLINKYLPDIIISDLAMPEINGMELMKLLEVKGISTPVFVFTGRSELRCLAEKFGNILIFEKPHQLNQLIDKVIALAS